MRFELRETGRGDLAWMEEELRRRWGSTVMISRGRSRDLLELPAVAALRRGNPAGLVTYRIEGGECEIVSLDSYEENRGVGTALVEEVARRAAEAGCTRLWLVTTNDNLHAIGFYQRRGFLLAAVHRGAVDEARRRKPDIPDVGLNRIPLRDEIEFEMPLPARGGS